LFDASGNALGGEFQMSVGTNVCANPNVSAGASGFAVAWSQRVGDVVVGDTVQTNAWDVFGRAFDLDGSAVSDPTVINTYRYGSRRFLALWTSFIGGEASFDLFAQRYAAAQPLLAPPAPFISALSQSRLSVTWPPLAGYDVDHYDLYVDDNPTPLSITNTISV